MTFPILAKVVLPSVSGLAEDQYVTDWVFDSTTPDTGGTAGAIASLLADHFFNHVSTPGRISDRLSSNIDRGADKCSVACYDISAVLGGGRYGSPTSVAPFTLNSTSNTNPMPEEVAIALSFHGVIAGVPETAPNPAFPPTLPKFFRPAARRRGRVFLGPWDRSICAAAGGHVFIDINTQVCILFAATEFLSAVTGSGDLTWSVWSRVDAALYPVVGGWLDNAFDTIRKRGSAANGRTDWP